MSKAFPSRAAESFGFRDVLYSKSDGVARIVINRPDRYNAYSTHCLEELATALRDASFDDAVGVLVLTGAGDRAFCTGGDVKEYAELYTRTPRDYWKYMGLFRAYIEGLLNSGKPTIARINGMAVGGGNESNLACDLAVMAEHAYLMQVGSSVGSVACGGATQWLPITIGDRRAREMLMLNEPVPARQALAWGLVTRVVPSVTRNGAFVEGASVEEIRLAQQRRNGYAIDLSRLDAEVDTLTGKLLDRFPECARYTKAQLNFWKELAWHQTIGHARDWLSIHYASSEPVEGMKSFVEKRKADYAGLRRRAALGEEVEFVWGAYTASCDACGAKNLPSGFRRCGICGAELRVGERALHAARD